MTVVLVIAGLFALVAFLYVFATERNNKILNAVMVTFGIILPGGFFGLAMNHAFGYQFPVIWWLDIIVGLIDLALLAYLIFVSGEALENVFDNYGNKIGTRGGSGGAAITAFAATAFLIGQFAPLFQPLLESFFNSIG